jgi:hypothetical protein
MHERQLTTAISGSFKLKPEIDGLIDQFTGLGVKVLEPTKGWLWTPRMQISRPTYRPLPDEQGLGIREIEDRFLEAIAVADFLYIYSQEKYVGLSTSFELGNALARQPEIPIYTAEPIAPILAEGDLEHLHYLESRLVIAGVAEAVLIEQTRRG